MRVPCQKFIGEAALVPRRFPAAFGHAIHPGLVLHQLFTVLITLLSASLLQPSLFVSYIAFRGPVAHPGEYIFSPFLPGVRKAAQRNQANLLSELPSSCPAARLKAHAN